MTLTLFSLCFFFPFNLFLEQGTTNKLSEVEIIRYQVLIPVTEVQVRSIGSGRDSACSMDGGSQSDALPVASTSSFDRPTEDASSLAAAGSQAPQFIWELIHLRVTTIPGGTQRRTEKVYQLSNRY